MMKSDHDKDKEDSYKQGTNILLVDMFSLSCKMFIRRIQLSK